MLNEYQEPLRLKNINLNNVGFGKMKEKGNKKIIFMNYNNRPFVFQCPQLQNITLPEKFDNYYKMELSLCEEKTNLLNKFIYDLEKIVVSYVIDNKLYKKSKYFNIIHSSSVSNDLVLPIKILHNDNFETSIYIDSKSAKIEDIKLKSMCKVILEIYAIWINDDGFGIYIRPVVIAIDNMKYKYKVLDDSPASDTCDILDTDVNNIFIKHNELSKDILKEEEKVDTTQIIFTGNDEYDKLNKESDTSDDTELDKCQELEVTSENK